MVHLVKTVKFKTISVFVLSILCTAIFCACIYFSGAHNVFFGGATTRLLPIYSVDRKDNKVAISFDCAWGTDYTDTILQELDKEGVRATFFMVEFWVEKYPDYAKKISDAGHEIGTHSATHSHMSKLSKKEIEGELSSSSKAIESLIGKKVELFRAPFGEYNDTLIKTATDMGYYTVQWDVDSLDWKNLSAKEILSRVCKRAQSGSIILMHNNGLHTAKAVPMIIRALKDKGLKFVPIGELIYRENFSIDANGKQFNLN